MKPPSINNRLRDLYNFKLRWLEKEYNELVNLMLTQDGAPSREQINRKNYLESELFILETNKQ